MVHPEEKQGYLGDLVDKSTEELRYLLKRQESVAANSKFMSRLPDRGAKIHGMIKKIEEILEQHAKVDETADLFKNLAINSERTRSQRGGRGEQEEDGEEVQMLRRLANRNQEEKIVVDERPDPEPDVKFVNSYETVIKKAEKRSSKTPKGKFKPNRSIKTKDVQDLVGKMKSPEVVKDIVMLDKSSEESPKPLNLPDSTERLQESVLDASGPSRESSKVTLPADVSLKESPRYLPPGGVSGNDPSPPDCPSGRLKHKYDELLEEKLYRGESHCESAKLISVEESIALQKTHQQKMQEIQAKYAATKLAERLNVKMSSYQPEGSSVVTRYRDTEAAADEDSDDEDEHDYPE